MENIKYRITFFSEWHTGSGLTSGSDLDALVIKDHKNLPFIPGKTLKGLLREAAENLQELKGTPDTGFLKEVFGMEPLKNGNPEKSEEGKVHFTNAELSNGMKKEVLKTNGNSQNLTTYLYRAVSSTAIGENGVAEPHSLRRMQTTIPVILEARILKIDKKFISEIIDCFKWIKRLGQNRNRGLGRCSIEIIKEGGVL